MSGFKGFDDDDDSFGGFGDNDFGGFGDFEEDGDDGFGSFGSDSPEREEYSDQRTPFEGSPEDLKGHKKTAFVVIGVGLVITLGIVGVMSMLGREPKENSEVNKENVQRPVEEKVETPVQVKSDWSEVEYTEIGNFVSIDSSFTVTGVKHYVKVLGENELVMKTIATGTLSGFGGTYTIELPYRNLKVGDKFNLPVKVGEYKGKTVISY